MAMTLALAKATSPFDYTTVVDVVQKVSPLDYNFISTALLDNSNIDVNGAKQVKDILELVVTIISRNSQAQGWEASINSCIATMDLMISTSLQSGATGGAAQGNGNSGATGGAAQGNGNSGATGGAAQGNGNSGAIINNIIASILPQLITSLQSSTTTIYTIVGIVIDAIEQFVSNPAVMLQLNSLPTRTVNNQQLTSTTIFSLIGNIISGMRTVIQTPPAPHTPIITNRGFFADNGWCNSKKISMFNIMRTLLFKSISTKSETVLQMVASDTIEMLEAATSTLQLSDVIVAMLTSLLSSIDAVYELSSSSQDNLLQFINEMKSSLRNCDDRSGWDYLNRLKAVKAPIISYLMSKVTIV